MVGVFVDTSAWFALASDIDGRHPDARRIYQALRDQGSVLHTTDWVLSETVALVERRVGRPAARRAGEPMLRSPSVHLHVLSADLVARAWERYAAAERGPGLVDCGSFVVMEAEGLSSAFAFDEDFSSAGFRLLA